MYISNDYRIVALTPIIMKTFERLVMGLVKSSTYDLLDLLQATDNIRLLFILKHSPITYAKILFVDFYSAFNAMVPELL